MVLAFPHARLRAAGGGTASGADLPAYTAARLPRTTAIARRAVRVGRLGMTGDRAVAAVRNTVIAALSTAGPALFLRGFDGIADRRPPYASGREHAGQR